MADKQHTGRCYKMVRKYGVMYAVFETERDLLHFIEYNDCFDDCVICGEDGRRYEVYLFQAYLH